MTWDMVASIIAAVAFLWAVFEFRHNMHERKEERTLLVFPPLREKYFNLYAKIYNGGKLTHDGEELLREYLSTMERFSVGVNSKLYDISLINRMSGGLLVGQYDSFVKAYIAERKKKETATGAYCKEYEEMIKGIRKRRQKKRENSKNRYGMN